MSILLSDGDSDRLAFLEEGYNDAGRSNGARGWVLLA